MTFGLRALLILCLATTLFAGCRTDPKVRADKAVARGDEYAAHQRLPEAVIEYRNALQAQPARGDVHYKLAELYMKQGDPVKAFASYVQAADFDQANVDAQVQAARLLIQAGQFDEAKRRAELAV